MAGQGLQFFGYQLSRAPDPKKEAEQTPSFAPPPNDDGAIEIAPGGAYGMYMDLEGSAKNEGELVTRYRELALQAEVDAAIEDIVNEAIIREDHKSPVEINLDEIELDDGVKETIRDEFKALLKLLDFNRFGYDIFKRWYVDGRLYYHMMIDETKPRDGIKEVRYIDPRRIRKVREPIKRVNAPRPGTALTITAPAFNEYFLYMHNGVSSSIASQGQQGIKIAKDSIAYIHSGVLDQKNKMVLSYLHKAIKPMNQLRMLEDAVVIYRLSRAPERRIFYIDVGNLPKMKAEQYLRDMMVKYKNKLVYDAESGTIRDDRKFMTMLEDFWLPRREGGRGTEITTLPGGQNLGQMEDVEYFRRKLYKALHVPISRISAEQTFNFGRANEITRDEVKFSKLIDRMRTRFSQLFNTLLETQLILRGVMTRDEWDQIKEDVNYDFLRDNYFSELKDQEIQTARLGLLTQIDPFTGKYYSIQYVREKILHMTEEDIEDIEEQIKHEAITNPQPNPFGDPNDPNGNPFGDPEGDPNAPPQQGGMQGPPGTPSKAQMQAQQPQKPGSQTPPPAGRGKWAPIGPKAKDKDDKPKRPLKEVSQILSPEEKKLVENMTKLLNSVWDEADEIDEFEV